MEVKITVIERSNFRDFEELNNRFIEGGRFTWCRLRTVPTNTEVFLRGI